MNHFTKSTWIGDITIYEKDGKITNLDFGITNRSDSQLSATPLIERAFRQLDDYAHSRRKAFKLDLFQSGTEFEKQVWEALLVIPYGQTITYQALAASIGRPKAYRAVGTALGKNHIPIIIPCHRVLGKSPYSGGYGGGLPIKQALLALESNNLN